MKNIYIAPYNKPGLLLAQELRDKGFENIYFIDTYKYDNKEVLHPQNICTQNVKEVLITSPNYFREIYNNLVANKLPSKKIFFYDSVFQKKFSSMFYYQIHLKLQEMLNYITLFISKYKLLKFKNKHLNQKCFILGNGPSLTINDLNKLQNEICFASNKIYLAFKETQWRPNYYFVEDHLVLKQNHKDICALEDFEKFFPHIALEWAPKIHNSTYYKLIYDFKQAHFSHNAMSGIYWGASVTYSMIEMAVYMGFKEIYLLGVDFSFKDSLTKKEIGNDGVFIYNGEVNHFHKEYRRENEQWTIPDMEFQTNAYLQASQYTEDEMITLVNCSSSTKLTVLKRATLESILGKNDD